MKAPFFRLVQHAVLADLMARLRDKAVPTPEFRSLLYRIGLVLAVEVSQDLETEPCLVETPLETAEARKLRRPVVLVPVLRAGLGLLDPFLELFPGASIGHIGAVRNEETLEVSIYLERMPKSLRDSEVIVLDPMLATGHSSAAVLQRLAAAGARHLRMACCLAAPRGVETVAAAFPQLPIYAAALDRELTPRGFIVPGLGDAGDRLFGT